jgi:hypothetical protein
MGRPVFIMQREGRAVRTAGNPAPRCVPLEELDDPSDADADAAWAAEIQRRSREIAEGGVQCIPGDEVFEKTDALVGN